MMPHLVSSILFFLPIPIVGSSDCDTTGTVTNTTPVPAASTAATNEENDIITTTNPNPPWNGTLSLSLEESLPFHNNSEDARDDENDNHENNYGHCLGNDNASQSSLQSSPSSSSSSTTTAATTTSTLEWATYFLHSEIEFLTRQSMIMGGYDHHLSRPTQNRTTQTPTRKQILVQELEFRRASLLRERNYLRHLRESIEAGNNREGIENEEEENNRDSIDTSRGEDESNTRSDSDRHEDTDQDDGENDEREDRTSHPLGRIVQNTRRVLRSFFGSLLRSFFHSLRQTSIPLATTTYRANKSTKTDDKIIIINDVGQHDMDYVEMYYHLQCHAPSTRAEKPLPTPRSRRILWETFRTHTLFPEFPFPPSVVEEEDSDERSSSSSSPLYTINHHPTDRTKGRGAFATRYLPRGTLVHGAHPGTVFFRNARELYRFVALLPTREEACDVLDWVWMQDLVMVREEGVVDEEDGDDLGDDIGEREGVDSDAYDEEGVEDVIEKERINERRRQRQRRRQTRQTWESGSKVLCLNLDDGAFINHGGQDEANIGLGYHHDYGFDYGDGSENKHSLEFYALRDIEEGEELLYDYDSTPWSLAEMDLNV